MTGSPQSWLPVQAAPVDRTPGGVALSGGSGVEASAWWDPTSWDVDWTKVAQTTIPIAKSIFGF
jgi:hypothetical protein